MKKKALIFGVTGQDGSYLADFLLKKKYQVHGVTRRSSSINTVRIDHIFPHPFRKKKYDFHTHWGDVTDAMSVSSLIKKIKPHEIYNLAAQSHVSVSFDIPEYTANADALGALRILEAIRFHKLEKFTKFYQAGTSEMFGKTDKKPQNEKTPFYPRSTYGISKVAGFDLTRNYREAYNLFCCSGILFNHESFLRPTTFVTQKIIFSAAQIKLGKLSALELGNLNISRDWGWAPEFVDVMKCMLNLDEPEDFVIGTGTATKLEDYVRMVFEYFSLDYRDYVSISGRNLRQNDILFSKSDPSKALEKLNWKASVRLDRSIEIMCNHQMEKLIINK